MAYNTTHVDLNRGTSGLSLPLQLSNEIMATAMQESAVMRLAPQIALPGSGITIPVILGDPEASWAIETEEKHVATPSLTQKNMKPYILQVTLPVSKQFLRDYATLYDEISKRLPSAIARKFDETVFFGTAPGTGFDVLTAAPQTYDGTTAWQTLVAAKLAVANNHGRLNGWAISPVGEASLLAAEGSGSGMPVFTSAVTNGMYDKLIGAPVVITEAADDTATGGSGAWAVAGDWSMTRWGYVGGIELEIADQATINDGSKQVNLWQRNMVAIRAEVEIGFVCADDDFFTLIGGTSSGD